MPGKRPLHMFLSRFLNVWPPHPSNDASDVGSLHVFAILAG